MQIFNAIPGKKAKHAVFCGGIAMSCVSGAFAENPIKNLDIYQSNSLINLINPARFGDPVLPANGTNRTQEFVLGEDGVVTPSAVDFINATAYEVRKTRQIQQLKPSGSLSKFTTQSISPATNSTEIAPNDLPNAQLGNAQLGSECGPSPLSVDEIKALIVAYARQYDVDASFALAIARAESQYDRNRNSLAGARGPMQLMPATAARFNVKDICDPESNIAGGIQYLRWLLDEFNNPLFAAAAYNAGEGRIYDYGGIPPFAETVNYVATIVSYQLGFEAPRKKTASKPKTTAANARTSNDNSKVQVEAKNEADLPAGFIGKSAPAKWNGSVLQF